MAVETLTKWGFCDRFERPYPARTPRNSFRNLRNHLPRRHTMDTNDYLVQVALLFAPDPEGLKGKFNMRSAFESDRLRESTFSEKVNGKTTDFETFLTEVGVPKTIEVGSEKMSKKPVMAIMAALRSGETIRQEKNDELGEGNQADVTDSDLYDKLEPALGNDDTNLLLNTDWVRAGLREYGRIMHLELERTGNDEPLKTMAELLGKEATPEVTLDSVLQAATAGMNADELKAAADRAVTAPPTPPVVKHPGMAGADSTTDHPVIHIAPPPGPPKAVLDAYARMTEQARAGERREMGYAEVSAIVLQILLAIMSKLKQLESFDTLLRHVRQNSVPSLAHLLFEHDRKRLCEELGWKTMEDAKRDLVRYDGTIVLTPQDSIAFTTKALKLRAPLFAAAKAEAEPLSAEAASKKTTPAP